MRRLPWPALWSRLAPAPAPPHPPTQPTPPADFNLSKILLEHDAVKSASLGASNPIWLAPEVLRGEKASAASDVFSFALVLFEVRPLGASRPSSCRVPRPARLPSTHVWCWRAGSVPASSRGIIVPRRGCVLTSSHWAACPRLIWPRWLQLLTWQLPWAGVPTYTVTHIVINGGRPEIPPWQQLPGPDTAKFAGLHSFVRLMRRVTQPEGCAGALLARRAACICLWLLAAAGVAGRAVRKGHVRFALLAAFLPPGCRRHRVCFSLPAGSAGFRTPRSGPPLPRLCRACGSCLTRCRDAGAGPAVLPLSSLTKTLCLGPACVAHSPSPASACPRHSYFHHVMLYRRSTASFRTFLPPRLSSWAPLLPDSPWWPSRAGPQHCFPTCFLDCSRNPPWC